MVDMDPVCYAREYDASKPSYTDVVLPDSQDSEMWAYALVPLYPQSAIDALRAEIEAAKEDAFASLALLSRMRFACGDNGTRMQDELEEYLAGLRRDAERMNWMADNLVIEGFASVHMDVYGYATEAADECGRDEPIQADVRSGIRRLLDAAMAAERGEG